MTRFPRVDRNKPPNHRDITVRAAARALVLTQQAIKTTISGGNQGVGEAELAAAVRMSHKNRDQALPAVAP